MTSFPAFAWLFVQTVSGKWRAINLRRFSEADIQSFSEEQENANKRKKISYNLKLFKEFVASEEKMQKFEEIPASELQ